MTPEQIENAKRTLAEARAGIDKHLEDTRELRALDEWIRSIHHPSEVARLDPMHVDIARQAWLARASIENERLALAEKALAELTSLCEPLLFANEGMEDFVIFETDHDIRQSTCRLPAVAAWLKAQEEK